MRWSCKKVSQAVRGLSDPWRALNLALCPGLLFARASRADLVRASTTCTEQTGAAACKLDQGTSSFFAALHHAGLSYQAEQLETRQGAERAAWEQHDAATGQSATTT
jgi:hypothetical protein